MRLHPGPFEAIKSGEKIYEMRLNDEKRQQMKVGDTIEFVSRADGTSFEAEIVELSYYKNFAEMYAALPLDKCGYKADEVANAKPEDMEQYYEPAEIEKFGTVAIKLRKN